MPSVEPAVLLDTHAWLWFVLGEPMAPSALELIRGAVAAQCAFLAPISCWEIGMLAAKGRIELPVPCEQWVDEALAGSGVQMAEFTPRIGVFAAFLPGAFHGDPADRIIVATAIQTGATLITRDARILEYAEAGQVSAVSA